MNDNLNPPADETNDMNDFARRLQAEFAGDPTPQHQDGFWSDFKAQATRSAEKDETLMTEMSGTEIEVPLFDANTPEKPSRFSSQTFLAAAAAILVVVAISASSLLFSRSDSPTSVASTATTSVPSRLDEVQADISSSNNELLFTSTTFTPTILQTLDTFDGSRWTSSPGNFQEPPEHIEGHMLLVAYVKLSEAMAGRALLPTPPGATHVAALGSDEIEREVQTDLADNTWKQLDPGDPATMLVISYHDPTVGLNSLAPDSVLPRPSSEMADFLLLEETGDGPPFKAAINDANGDRIGDQPVEQLSDAARERLTQLPDDFSPSTVSLAASITEGASSDYERALMLQDYFSGLTLVLDGENVNSIDEFLETGEGTVADFASANTAMLRSLGVPSRIALGFRQGVPTLTEPGAPNEDGSYPVSVTNLIGLNEVRVNDAHAWTEINIDGYWVRVDAAPRPAAPDPILAIAEPLPNGDTWHAVYGVYDCRDDAYLPPFESAIDPFGIHSHQDGVIHIHPFFQSVAGENAVFGLFLESMEVEVTADGLESPEFSLPAEATCGESEAVLHLRKWRDDFAFATEEPEIVTIADLASVRFLNDREVYVLALAPLDARMPNPPFERFAAADRYTRGLQSGEPITDRDIDFEPDLPDTSLGNIFDLMPGASEAPIGDGCAGNAVPDPSNVFTAREFPPTDVFEPFAIGDFDGDGVDDVADGWLDDGTGRPAISVRTGAGGLLVSDDTGLAPVGLRSVKMAGHDTDVILGYFITMGGHGWGVALIEDCELVMAPVPGADIFNLIVTGDGQYNNWQTCVDETPAGVVLTIMDEESDGYLENPTGVISDTRQTWMLQDGQLVETDLIGHEYDSDDPNCFNKG